MSIKVATHASMHLGAGILLNTYTTAIIVPYPLPSLIQIDLFERTLHCLVKLPISLDIFRFHLCNSDFACLLLALEYRYYKTWAFLLQLD